MPVLSHRVSSVPNPTQPFPDGLVVAGPRVAIQLEVPGALAKQLAAAGAPVPAPVTGYGLVDTGATRSAIDQSAVSRLSLQPVGVVTSGTAAGPSQHALYPLKVVLPQMTYTIEFGSVTGCNLSGMNLVMLIGRDVLRLGLFHYDGVSGAYALAI